MLGIDQAGILAAQGRNTGAFGLDAPTILFGVTCLVFGVGTSTAGWIDRLIHSAWFAGLTPRPEDLAVSGGVAAGCWSVPVRNMDGPEGLEAWIDAFVARGLFPKTPLATVAVSGDAGPHDQAAALALVRTMRSQRDASGCRTAVIVTIEAGMASVSRAFVGGLLEQGAFVVQAGLGVPGDHIHHFPLRAATIPRNGRLVCVDLADHLATWCPGSMAYLLVIPSGVDEAVQVVPELAGSGDVRAGRVRGLNLHLHVRRDAGGDLVTKLDRLATACQALLLGPTGDLVFTTANRMDSVSGSADLLVIHDACSEHDRI